MPILKRCLLITLMCFATSQTFAQKHGKVLIDSLSTELAKAKEDTNKVNLLIRMCDPAINTAAYDTAYSYAQKALLLAQQLNYKKGAGAAYHNLGTVQAYQGNHAEALKKFLAALELHQAVNNKKGVANAHIGIGNLHQHKGEYNESIKSYRAALKIQEEMKDMQGMSYSYYNISGTYYMQGNYPETIASLLATLKINEQIGNKRGIANVYCGLGSLYYTQVNTIDALKNYYLALKIQEEIEDKRGMATSYNGIGDVYSFQGNYTKALKNFSDALKIQEEIGNKAGIAYSYTSIGHVHSAQRNYTEALKNNFAALKIQEEIGDKPRMAVTYNEIGNAFFGLNNITEGRNWLFKALNLSIEAGEKESIKTSYSRLARTDSASSNFKDAFENYKMYVLYKDSLYNEENTRKLTQAAMQYSFDKTSDSLKLENEKNALALQKEIQLQQLRYEFESKEAAARTEKERQQLKYEELLKRQKIENEYEQKQAAVIAEHKQRTAFEKATQEKKDAIAQSELQQQKLLRNGFIGGFIIVLGFATVFLRQRNNTKRQRERAERSEKFKQQFLANMSHEIRTPINAIMGMTNLTLDTSLDTKQRNYLKVVQKSSHNLLHIINDILDLSKMEAGKMELEQIDFSLRDVVAQVGQTLQHRAKEKGIELLHAIQDDIADVWTGDPVRLYQVLLNLAGNAVKFTDKGSVQLIVNAEQQGLKFSIIDTGIGIKADKIQSIFESFAQAHTSDTRIYGGTGLGLTISKQLVELMGGKITIESQWGSGSEFSFILNLPKGNPENLHKQSSEIDGSILNGLKILLVDDNEDNRIVCKDTLSSKADVTIVEAANGQEALNLLNQHHFDIILMDVQMPVMDGYEATRQIRKLNTPHKDIPIIALTASVIRSDLDKCREAGMNDYVPKPFTTAQLFGTIATLTNKQVKFAASTAPIVAINEASGGQYTNLAYLEQFCEGDRLKMQKYINIFLESVPLFIEKMNIAIADANKDEIASLSHSFKTKFVMMGMDSARLLAAQLEHSCRAADAQTNTIIKGAKDLIKMVTAATNELKN